MAQLLYLLNILSGALIASFKKCFLQVFTWLVIIILLGLFQNNVIAQHAPIKYGKLDEKEISLKEYAGADAVILCDYGWYKFSGLSGNVYFEHTRNLRIKILTEAGLRYATQKVSYYDLHAATFYKYSRPYFIYAQTLNIDPKGKVVKSKVKSKGILEQKPDENFNSSITINFPDVKVGSIIEYEVNIPTLETVNPKPWMVQYDIPVLWSELRITTPLEFNYAMKPYNMDYYDVLETKGVSSSIQYPGRSFVYNGNQMQFVRKNVPSLPIDGNEIDYNNKRMYVKFMLDFASTKYLFPMMGDIFKATDPEFKYLDKSQKQTVFVPSGFILYRRPNMTTIAKDLNKNEQFGIPLILNMGMNDSIKKMTEGLNSDDKKVAKIYDFVSGQTEWDHRYRIFVDAGLPLFMVKLAGKFSKDPVKVNRSLTKVMNRQTGSNSEINAILINLLRAGGFKANPVLVSTLNFSYIDTSFFNLHQFNHLVALVEINGNEIILDAVKTPQGTLINSEPFNEWGLAVEMQKARWVRVSKPYSVVPAQKQGVQSPIKKPEDPDTKYY